MNIIAPLTQNQVNYLNNCMVSWLNVAEGGKRGSKNVLNTLVFCTIIENHPNKIHLAAGVSVATAKLNILDCDGYGLINYFEGRCREGKYKDRDCLYIKTKTGEKVVLISGGGKSGDEKLIKGNTYGAAYITEANECHPDFIKEVFDRTLSSKDRKVLHDLNPKAQSHFYYVDILGFHEGQQKLDPEYGYNYGHFTIADNMSLSDDQLKKLLVTYDKKSVWYQRDILGLRKQVEGLVYPMFSRERHVTDLQPIGAENYVSIDYGTANPFSAGFWNWDGKRAIRKRELYWNSRKEGKRLDDEAYYTKLEELIGGEPVQYIIIDPSAASFIEVIQKYGKYIVVPAKNEVINGIQVVTKLLNMDILLFHESCSNTFDEFDLYSWDDKNQKEDTVIKENDHAMDDIRYFCNTFLRQELRWT